MTFEQQPDQVNRERIVVAPGRSGQSEYFTLKAREKELTDQRENLEERREELAQQLLQASSGVARAGIEQRLTAMDNRLTEIEADLSKVGREAMLAAPATIAEPKPEVIYRGFGEEDLVGAGLMGALMMLTLLSPFLFRWLRRRKSPQQTTGATPALNAERVDRMEQAIDSIAVEIERVSENQRFMTRLMTETQLAGTIAAVRGSTEAAKAAAEKAQNV
jgi:hypothetical protein